MQISYAEDLNILKDRANLSIESIAYVARIPASKLSKLDDYSIDTGLKKEELDRIKRLKQLFLSLPSDGQRSFERLLLSQYEGEKVASLLLFKGKDLSEMVRISVDILDKQYQKDTQ